MRYQKIHKTKTIELHLVRSLFILHSIFTSHGSVSRNAYSVFFCYNQLKIN